MNLRFKLVLAALACSTAAFAQSFPAGSTFLNSADPDAFQVRYVANLHVGSSFVDIVNTGASATAASGFITGGNICVQVYAFDNSEELLACCTCRITPNGLASIEVDDTPNGLFGNTETGAAPSSGVIKLVATADSAACGTSAAAETAGTLVPGMAAWATTLHQLVIPPGLPSTSTTYQQTETPFSITGLSAGEYAHLTTFCSFDVVNGTKQGVCPGCSATGLGAAAVQ